jgi:hypothetical protein
MALFFSRLKNNNSIPPTTGSHVIHESKPIFMLSGFSLEKWRKLLACAASNFALTSQRAYWIALHQEPEAQANSLRHNC